MLELQSTEVSSFLSIFDIFYWWKWYKTYWIKKIGVCILNLIICSKKLKKVVMIDESEGCFSFLRISLSFCLTTFYSINGWIFLFILSVLNELKYISFICILMKQKFKITFYTLSMFMLDLLSNEEYFELSQFGFFQKATFRIIHYIHTLCCKCT